MLVSTVVSGPSEAAVHKGLVHAAVDLPFVLAAILAPFGIVFSRNRTIAWLVAIWIAQYLGLLSLMLWSGTRFRSPVEPTLIVLAALVVVGRRRSPGRPALVAAAATSCLVAIGMGMSLSTTLPARPNYGVESWDPVLSRDTTFTHGAGLNVLATTSVLTLTLEDASPPRPGVAAFVVDVRVNGRRVESVAMHDGASQTVRYVLPNPGLVYVELTIAESDRTPVALHVRLPS